MEQQLPEPVRERIATLQRLKAVGPVSSRRLVLELFWRQFQNPGRSVPVSDYVRCPMTAG